MAPPQLQFNAENVLRLSTYIQDVMSRYPKDPVGHVAAFVLGYAEQTYDIAQVEALKPSLN